MARAIKAEDTFEMHDTFKMKNWREKFAYEQYVPKNEVDVSEY